MAFIPISFFITFAVFLICFPSETTGDSVSPSQAIDNIRSHLRTFKDSKRLEGQSLCDTYSCCTMSASESCSLSSDFFPRDESRLVLPGGETRCIFSYSTPFAFQVIKGDSDKLLFYFQGGGACWDKVSTEAGLCTTDSSPQDLIGVFDRKNDLNAFKGYTIVHVLYCSGDVHGGNVVRNYNDKKGSPVIQKGIVNAQSALDWVAAQMSTGGLSSTLSELVIMGCSAGSLGAQVWASQVLNTLKWKTASIIPDSYAGIFPPNTVGPLLNSYGFCSSGFLSADLTATCYANQLTVPALMESLFASVPTIPVSFIQSKTDIVQISFYVSIGATMNSTAAITPSEFYNDVNTLFGEYNSKLPNFVTYLVNGDQHCFSPLQLYYSADLTGPLGDGKSSNQDMLYQWSGLLPLAESEKITTLCDGGIQSTKLAEDTTYCSSSVVPKTFVEHY